MSQLVSEPSSAAIDGLTANQHPATTCRLCGGAVEKQFDLTVLGRLDVGYWRCSKCASLQTDEPYWLAEAYAHSLALSDVGAVGRCLSCRAAIWLIVRMLRLRESRLLDFGGGSGLLCRLLRDVGIDAWTCDLYGKGEYAQLFRIDMGAAAAGSFDVVTAFEVFEHLPHPDEDLAKLFLLGPQVLIASTEPIGADSNDGWWYLSPSSGQHVFFYSKRALQLIADRYQYSLLSVGGWHIFTRRPINPITRGVLSRALSRPSLRLIRAVLEGWPNGRHLARDHQRSLDQERRPRNS